MASKKQPAKSSTKPKSGKASSKGKVSVTTPKASKASSQKASTKRTKPQPSKKATSKPKSSILTVKKPKAHAPSKKTTSSSSASHTNSLKSAATRGSGSWMTTAFTSSQDRYNVGGLCACVIDTSTSAGEAKLRQVLTYLQLSEMDQANLYRVSQGVRIPKLFADHFVREDVRRNILQSLTQFASADDSTGKKWTTELEDLRRLLAS